MIRRAAEWVLGSIVVYLVVAACAGSGAMEGLPGTGGILGMLGGSETGSGATPSSGASGGVSIIDPVPDADAAEDGTRIVNIYRTTPDGLKTHDGYWDKELQIRCNFMLTADGKDRCAPMIGMYGSAGTYFADAACTIPVAYSTKGNCFEYALQIAQVGTCGVNPSYTIYRTATKVSAAYQKSAETCVALSESLLGQIDIFTITEIPPSEFAEGAVTHD